MVLPAKKSILSLVLLLALVFSSAPAHAAGTPAAANAPDAPLAVIGSGTPASCQSNAATNAFTNAVAAGGTITFNCGSSPVVINSNTNLTNQTVVIDGGGLVALSGEDLRQLFLVTGSGNLTLRNISLIDGDASFGGAINLSGPQTSATLVNVFLTSNHANSNGGAVFNEGALAIYNSSIGANSAAGNGGAIFNNGGTLTLKDVTVINNQATDGGGIFNSGGSVSINQSAIRSNIALDDGGGIFHENGNLTLTNTTFYDNRASGGGGLYTTGTTVNITNVTFNRNRADTGGALWNFGGATSAKNSIFANSRNTNDSFDSLNCDGSTLLTQGRNIVSDNTCVPNPSSSGDLLATDPQLNILNDYGGKTRGFFPLPGSPAINYGLGCPRFDQRGVPRSKDPFCEVGSMEAAWANNLPFINR